MANTKKYVSLDKLGYYDEKIKGVITAGDAASLQSAKDYADGLAVNYDAAGSAATAEANAKAYADGKDAAIAAAKKAGDDAAAAAAVADGKAVAAQGEVDALEAYVGTFTHDTAQTVVEYINAKTDGIATSGNLEALANRVTQTEKDIDAIEADYLKSADKTELEGKITAEENRAKGIEDGLGARIKAVEDDYLKAADKTELTQAIATAKQEAVATVLGEGVDEDFDTLKEVADWILSDTTGAAALQTDVAQLKVDVDAVEEKVTTLEGEMDAVEGAVATKVEQEAYNEKVAALEGADAGQVERIAALEAKFGEGEGSVADQIADAKQEAIDAAAGDATTKADAAKDAAIAKANELNTAMNTRVEALEAVDHEHANKDLLDTYTQTEADLADAVSKKHAHSNFDVLEGITAAKVSAWDAAEGNAKTYADGLNTAMNTRVEALETWHANFIEVSEEDINALFA